MSERVPMSPNPAELVRSNDVELSATSVPGKVGKRFSMVVDELVLMKAPRAAVVHALERLGEQVACPMQREVEQRVGEILADRAWLRPIVEDEIRKTVRAHILSIFAPPEEAPDEQ